MRLASKIPFTVCLLVALTFAVVKAERIPPLEVTIHPAGTGDYPTIQEGLDAVADGGTVYLENGIFTGPGNINLNFHGKDIWLRSLSLDPGNCIIDCGGIPGPREFASGRPSHSSDRNPGPGMRAFLFDDGEGPGAIVEGLKVMHGEADFGGAINILNSSPTFNDCVFCDNHASQEGGALWMSGGSPNFNGCVFQDNSSTYGGAAQIYDPGSAPTFSETQFLSNMAEYSGAIDVYEGGSLELLRSVFFKNVGESNGGAISDWDAGQTRIDESTFAENESDQGGHIYFGVDFDVVIGNTIMALAPRGGAMRIEFFSPRENLFDFECCNVFGNVGGDWEGDFAGYSEVNGNFSADPQFCGNIGNGNLYLQSDSACAPANSGGCGLVGALPVDCDETSSATSTWSQVKRLY